MADVSQKNPNMKLITSQQIIPGMMILVDEKLYRVEYSLKVNLNKGSPFVKTKLKDLISEEIIEKNFKIGQHVSEVALTPRKLEFLFLDKGEDYLFLDTESINTVTVPLSIIGDRINYLKEAVGVKALGYDIMEGENQKTVILSIELPQFLELIITKTDMTDSVSPLSNATKVAVLETGAKIEVPLFVESGDIIKIDTYTNEYVQRV